MQSAPPATVNPQSPAVAGLSPDLRFLAALGLLGMVMLTISPRAAFWLGAVLILAALTYAEVHAKASGHSFIGDVQAVFLGGGSKQ